MTKVNLKQPPGYEQRADLYIQLARMEEAGLSSIEAVRHLSKLDAKLGPKLAMTAKFLQSGRSIAEAGQRSGLLFGADLELVKAGERSGQLSAIYRQLADYYSDKVRRLRKIKSRLFLPLTILFLALMIQPIPALFIGSITVLEYLLTSIGAFIYLLLALYIIWRTPFWLTEGNLRFLGLRNTVFQLQLSLPFIADWIIRRQTCDFIQILGLMLNAGIPVLEALPKSANTIKNCILGQNFKEAAYAIEAGFNLTEAFAQIKFFNRTALQLISSGEQSGKLAETLLHFADLEAESINIQEEMLAEWIPRIIYGVITLWIGYSIIASYVGYFDSLNQTINNIR